MKKATRYFILTFFLLFAVYLFLKTIIASFFVHRHNEAVLSRIKIRDAQSYTRFSAFADAVESETDWHIVITSGYRTEEEQAILNENDARNADAGQSKHNFGKAIDLNFYKNKGLTGVWLMKNSSKKRWEDSGILKIAKKYRLKWGGNFRNYYDPVHFEVE
jgi:LAS superfamily LD-carboxypeptidase LdcB